MQTIQVTAGAIEYSDTITVSSPTGDNVNALDVRVGVLPIGVRDAPAGMPWHVIADPDITAAVGLAKEIRVLVGDAFAPAPAEYQWWSRVAGGSEVAIFPVTDAYVRIT